MSAFPQTIIPTTIGGNVAWLDATQTSTITSSGGLASSVRNKANSQIPFTQGTGANQPTTGSVTIGGLNALGFDGTDDSLVATASSAINNIFATGGTVIIVANVIGMGGGSGGRFLDKTSIILHVLSLSGSTCKVRFVQSTSATSGSWDTTNTVVTLGQPMILMVTYDASTLATAPKIYLNSTTEVAVSVVSSPTGSASSDAANNLTIGNNSGATRCLNGYMAEAIFYRRVLSSTERSNLFNDLSRKYGIALS